LFAHNGAVQDFRTGIMRALRNELSDERYAGIVGGTDSEHLFALWLEHLLGDGATPGDRSLESAAVATVRDVDAWVRAKNTDATLNLMATDGLRIVATRHSTTERAPSLYTLTRGEDRDREIYIVSERLFADERWREVPRNSVVTASREHGIEVASL
jgi:glutamine amidotransferase